MWRDYHRERKKHRLGVGYACLPGGEGRGGFQFGAAGFGILRLEVTQPTMQELQARLAPLSNL